MPYVCGKCYKTKSGAGGRKHRGRAPAAGKKRRSAYQACLSREMKRVKAPDQSTKMHLVQNACGRLRKKSKKR